MKVRIDLVLGAALATGAVAAPALAGRPGEEGATAARPGVAADRAFVPPSERMVLTRELRKTMGNGRIFLSRRSYAVRFVPVADGWSVQGTLVTSEVEAPPGVPPQLVELERSRSDGGLFPIALDRAGLIVRQPGPSDPRASAAALVAARDALGRSALSSNDRAAATALVAQLQVQSNAAGGNWPVDLFRPPAGERDEVRTFPLASGSEGRVTVSIAAADAPDGVLERLERKVVTEAAGTSRVSVETWTLARSR